MIMFRLTLAPGADFLQPATIRVHARQAERLAKCGYPPSKMRRTDVGYKVVLPDIAEGSELSPAAYSELSIAWPQLTAAVLDGLILVEKIEIEDTP